MSDDSPFPPNEAPADAPKPRGGISNLLPPCKPGEVRNKYGRNGRDKNKIIVDFMEEIDPRDKKERTRIRAFLETTYLRSLAGHSVAIKYLGEHYAGRAVEFPNGLQIADHLRAVEKDRIATVIACLGSKLRTLSPVEMRDFFETCANDPEKFMVKAEQLLEGAPEPEQEQQAQLPESEAKP